MVLVVIWTIVGVSVLLALPPAPAQSWTVVRGTGTASDGRIAITVGASRLALVHSYDNATQNVFLLVNLTFANVGSGNTSTSAGWFVNVVWNGTEHGNTWFQVTGPDAAGELPIPDVLAPGQRISGWVAFYIPPIPDASAQTRAALHIETVMYYETSYGGQYLGDGGRTGAVETFRVRFEIAPA